MLKTILGAIAPISNLRDLDKIIRIDAEALVTNHATFDRFVEKNRLTYFLCMNAWYSVIEQYSRLTATAMLQYASKYGFIETIKLFVSFSTDLINSGPSSLTATGRLLYIDIGSALNANPQYPATRGVMTTDEVFLEICRFPKRFSLSGATALKDESLKDFFEFQKTLKYRQRKPETHIYRVITRYAAQFLRSYVDWRDILTSWNNLDVTDGVFSAGICDDSSKKLISKLCVLNRTHPWYFHTLMGVPLVHEDPDKWPSYWGRTRSLEDEERTQWRSESGPDVLRFEVKTVKPRAVPKNYKTARIIAPETVYRQMMAQAMSHVLDKHMMRRHGPGHNLDIHDQERQCQLAFQGSTNGLISTFDLSKASDSITLPLLYDLFGAQVVEAVESVLPTHYVKPDGSAQLLQSKLMMGNGITFIFLTMTTWAIACAGVKYASLFKSDSEHMSDEEIMHSISVYGDDVIGPTEYAESIVDAFEACGFQINSEKSYWSTTHLYRESCGSEWYCGKDVSTIYYPRFAIEGELCVRKGDIVANFSNKTHLDSHTEEYYDSLMSVVSLQRRLMQKGYTRASTFLYSFVQELVPQMTVSTPDISSETSDLIGYVDISCRKRNQRGTPPASLGDAPLRVYRETPVVVWDTARAITPQEQCVFDYYRYTKFLKYGPQYDTELDKLLGTSSKPTTINQVAGEPKIVWRMRATD